MTNRKTIAVHGATGSQGAPVHSSPPAAIAFASLSRASADLLDRALASRTTAPMRSCSSCRSCTTSAPCRWARTRPAPPRRPASAPGDQHRRPAAARADRHAVPRRARPGRVCRRATCHRAAAGHDVHGEPQRPWAADRICATASRTRCRRGAGALGRHRRRRRRDPAGDRARGHGLVRTSGRPAHGSRAGGRARQRARPLCAGRRLRLRCSPISCARSRATTPPTAPPL